jgi:hypothetical protein
MWWNHSFDVPLWWNLSFRIGCRVSIHSSLTKNFVAEMSDSDRESGRNFADSPDSNVNPDSGSDSNVRDGDENSIQSDKITSNSDSDADPISSKHQDSKMASAWSFP